MKIVYLCFMCSLLASYTFGQTEEKKDFRSGLSFGGQLMLSTDFDNLFYNMGGGGISLNKGDLALSINFLPSLRYNFDAEKVTPTLGIGPQLHIRNKWLVGVPVYYIDNNWKATFGLGYKFAYSCPQ